jgi:L-malate glycosyltransferase
MMKILVIWRLLTVGGVNAGWRNRAIYFKKYGIETEFLYTTDHGGMHIMEDVAKVYLTKDKDKIVNIIKENQYDAVIVVDTKDAFKWLKKAQYNGPVIVEARTPELIKLTPHIKNFRGIQPVAVIVPSHYQKRLVSILIEGIPIEVIYNGIDPSNYYALSEQEINHEAEPFLPQGKKVIGWIGRLDKRKNWPMLVEIAKRVKQERNDIEFWIIGGAQSVQRDEFAATWKEEGLTDIIKWFPVIPYQQMPHVYAKIRQSGGCTIATTKTESFGNTFVESMLCGVPVVASRMMPITEIVKDGKTGKLFHGMNIDDAIKQLYFIVDQPEVQKAMSEAAILHTLEHFHIHQVAEKYVQFLLTIVQKGMDKDGVVKVDD